MSHNKPRALRILRVRLRRLCARVDRRAAALLVWVPSYGTSLMIHGLIILLLGLYVYAHSGKKESAEIRADFANTLGDDLTSLTESDHSGDPFTTLTSPDPPSLSLTTPEPDLKIINQPEIPRLSSFAPVVASREVPKEPSPTGKGARGTAPAVHVEDTTAPFSGRQGDAKAAMVRREGGTVRSEKAVQDGLDWLARHQRDDGSWSLNFHSRCVGDGCPPQESLETDTAATGLALLPLLGAGHVHTAKSRYQDAVRRGIEWLVAHQQPTGDLFVGGGSNTYLYSHAIATMALCEAYGVSKDAKLKEPAQRAIDFIIACQNTETGGWRYFPGQPGDTSVFGWQMFALRSARLAGLRVPKNVLLGCKAYLDAAAADNRRVTYSYLPGRSVSAVMTAEALLSRQYLGWPRDYPPLVKGASLVAQDLAESDDRNIYYWYYATQLLHNMQNKDWQRWNVTVREGLIKMQVGGIGCDRGSWDPFNPVPDRWATGFHAGGRLYLTSLSLLTLEVYYRYLPLYRTTDTDELPKAGDKPDDKVPIGDARRPDQKAK